MLRIAALVALLMVWLAPSALAQADSCADFETQEEAQLYFILHGGPDEDEAGLDPDEDGIACETLPSQSVDDDDDEPEETDEPDDDDDDADDDDDDSDDDPASTPREPREPREPRSAGGGGSDGGRTLPVTGQQIALFGGSGSLIAGLGFGLVAWARARRRVPYFAPRGEHDAPWGDDTLIGW